MADNDEVSTTYDHPLPGIEGLPSGILPNGNQVASTSSINDGINLDETFLNPSPEFENFPDTSQFDSGENLFANAEERTGLDLSPSFFSATNSENFFINDGTTSSGEDLLASAGGDAEGILPSDSFSVAASDFSSGLDDLSDFSAKRGIIKKARAV